MKLTYTGTAKIRGSFIKELQRALDAAPRCDLCGTQPMACTATDNETGETQRWCADCAQAQCQRHGYTYEDVMP